MKTWVGASGVGLLLLLAAEAHGRTFIVTDQNDTKAVRSLRGAIIEANRHGGYNQIFLTHANYELTIPGPFEDAGQTGDLDVTNGSLVITAALPGVTIGAKNLGDRIFQVHKRARLALHNITLKEGKTPDGAYAQWTHFDPEPGGAIFNSGFTTLWNCSVVSNSVGAGGVLLGNGPGGKGGSGGGIFNEGSMEIYKCRIEGNAAGPSVISSFGGDGGGIYNVGRCVIQSSLLSSNKSGTGGFPDGIGFPGYGGHGGAVYNAGEMTLQKCTIVGNSTGDGTEGSIPGIVNLPTFANDGGQGGNGGGIYNTNILKLALCTLSSNWSGNGGDGGNADYAGIGGSGGSGGGIFNSGTATLESCTVCFNRAGNAGQAGIVWFGGDIRTGAVGGSGGGIYNNSTASVDIRNTLVASNQSGDGGLGTFVPIINVDGTFELFSLGERGAEGIGSDLFGNVDTRGFNFIGNADGSSGVTNGIASDLAGDSTAPLDPLLGPLQFNGGFTPTHMLLPGSPAIDKGRRFGFAKDQRDHHRLHDFASVSNASCGDGTDIGAFEQDAPCLNIKKLAGCSVLSWDRSCSGYTLEVTTNLNLVNGWVPVAGSPCAAGCELQVTNSVDTAFKFFRLRKN